MTYKAPTKKQALLVASEMKRELTKRNLPVVGVFLFGSLASGKRHKFSDIDIAVVYHPFGEDRFQEHMRIREARTSFAFPMDIVCLYPEDLESTYWGIAQEVKKHGIRV